MKLPINKTKRPGSTLAGVLGVALSSILLLCGAGLTPTGNVQKSDINGNGFSLTNAATVQATNFVGNGANITNVTAAAVPWTGVTARPTLPLTLANGGTGATNVAAAQAALGLTAAATNNAAYQAPLTFSTGLTQTGTTVTANLTSVAGRTGSITLSASDVSGLGSLATTGTITLTGSVTGSSTVSGTLVTINTSHAAASVSIANLTATGTASSSTFHRGDNTWASAVQGVTAGAGLTTTVTTGSGGIVTNTGTLSFDPAWFSAHSFDVGRFPVSNATTGSGSTGTNLPYGWTVATGTTTSSTAMTSASPYWRFAGPGCYFTSVNFAVPIAVSLPIWQESTQTSGNGVAYFTLGKSSAYAGNLTNAGIGVKMQWTGGTANTLNFSLQAYSGSTLTTAASPVAIALGLNTTNMITLFSDGAGNLTLYQNGVLKQTITGAPTSGLGTNWGNVIELDIANGADASSYYLQTAPPGVSY